MATTSYWFAGTNVPGYLPDSDPRVFADHETARAFLIDELLWMADTADVTADEADALALAAEDINLWSGEDSITVAGCAYWIAPATAHDYYAEYGR